ncbi:MAG TPA: ATP-grasp domain-containing protein [Pirellulales bacterium]|nr:ATP-grasp domain-containing protein [Pirellulales bacterium]
MHTLILFNEPTLPREHPDWAQEAGVLESVQAIEGALTNAAHRTSRLGIRTPHEAIDAIHRHSRPDVVFNLFEGFGGVGTGEAAVAGLLDLMGWPYTGSPAECLGIARDKLRTKRLLAGAGLPTPRAVLVADNDRDFNAIDELLSGGPCIVKPADQDGSLGIGADSIVHDMDAAEQKVDSVLRHWGPALIERFVDGREFNVSTVDVDRRRVLPLAEIEFDACVAGGRRIVTYDAKWASESPDCIGTVARCPAQVDEQLEREIERVSLSAFEVLGCRDYARVDLRISERGEVFILEVNANPDLDPQAGLARALGVAGIDYDAFIVQLAENAARR